MAALGSRVLGNAKDQSAKINAVSEHALSPIPLDHWTLTVMEVNYPAGSCSCPRSDPGFVVGICSSGRDPLS